MKSFKNVNWYKNLVTSLLDVCCLCLQATSCIVLGARALRGRNELADKLATSAVRANSANSSVAVPAADLIKAIHKEKSHSSAVRAKQ